MATKKKDAPVSDFDKFITQDEDGDIIECADTLNEAVDDAEAHALDVVSENESEGEKSFSVAVYRLVKVVTVRTKEPETTVSSVA